jgi:hypothetical protein
MPQEFTVGDFVQDMREGLAPQLLAPFCGITCDYSHAELLKAERHFDESFRGRPPKAITTYLPFAFLLGESIVRNVPGAEWENLESGNPWDMCVSVPVKDGGHMKCWPMERVRKFHEDPEDRMTTLLWMTGMLAKHTTQELLRMGTHKGDGWVSFPDENGGEQMMRVSTPKEPDKVSREDVPSLGAEDRVVHYMEDGVERTAPMRSMESPTKPKGEESEHKEEKTEEKQKKRVYRINKEDAHGG